MGKTNNCFRRLQHADLCDVASNPNTSISTAPAHPPCPGDTGICHNPGCGKTDTLKACGRCRLVWYCSPACQKAHWPKHKIVCKQLLEPLPPAERDPKDHPAGATFLFQGSTTTTQRTQAGDFQVVIVCENIFGRLWNGRRVYVQEVVRNFGSVQTRTHQWMDEASFQQMFPAWWTRVDGEPNRNYNRQGGIRSAGGRHLSGTNDLVLANGTLQMAGIAQALAGTNNY